MQATTGQMPEWSKGEDLRSSSIALRGFEPHSGHLGGEGNNNGMAQRLARRTHNPKVRGSSPLPVRQWITGLESFQKNRLLVWVPSFSLETLSVK